MKCDSLISAIGGHHKSGSYDILKHLGHHIIEPTPSLFTFNLPNENIRKELQGLSVQKAEVYLEGSKNHYIGPVLITHWGLSGPAVLKLSAFASKDLFEKNYKAVVIVNWAAELKMHEIQEELLKIKEERARQFPYTTPHFGIPKRLWEFFCEKAELSKEAKWSEVPKKNIHWLSEIVGRSKFQMEGKTTFKEEFVTCGGVDLKEVNLKTMESKKIKGLYFCGEVLDIDGVTGGFNFQNAWSTAWICADSIATKLLHIRSG